MKRRWFIRICFMLPILLCLDGWGWTRTYIQTINYTNDDTRAVCVSGGGMFSVYLGRWSDIKGWHRQDMVDIGVFHLLYDDGWTFHGFGLGSIDLHRWGYGLCYWLSVPYWFLSSIFSAALFFAWRKTRPAKPGRAFPVQPAATEQKS